MVRFPLPRAARVTGRRAVVLGADLAAEQYTARLLPIASVPITAPRAADAIRAHGRIETTSHGSRDITFGEDRSRIRFNPGVFACLHRFGFNILKAHRTNTMTQDRYRTTLAGIDKMNG